MLECNVSESESRMHLRDGGSHVTFFLSEMLRDKADFKPRQQCETKANRPSAIDAA